MKTKLAPTRCRLRFSKPLTPWQIGLLAEYVRTALLTPETARSSRQKFKPGEETWERVLRGLVNGDRRLPKLGRIEQGDRCGIVEFLVDYYSPRKDG